MICLVRPRSSPGGARGGATGEHERRAHCPRRRHIPGAWGEKGAGKYRFSTSKGPLGPEVCVDMAIMVAEFLVYTCI